MKTLVTAALAALPLIAGDAQLAGVIKSGQRAAALEMIAKKSADVNAAEADGSTPLLWAANLNDTDLVTRRHALGAARCGRGSKRGWRGRPDAAHAHRPHGRRRSREAALG